MTAAQNFGNHSVDECGNNEETDIIPIDVYNAEQGKLFSSLSWLISKVYGKNIPDTLVQPCYKDDNNVLHLKPGTMYSLTSGELYCAAAATIFHDVGYLNQNHGAVLQALKRYSIQVVDVDEQFVTETILTQTAPFKLNAHLAMIDALMTAYTREIISVARVVECLKKYVNVHVNETPMDVEDALLFWINKICSAVRDNLEKYQVTKNSNLPVIPEMEDMYEDICDGACVATLISFYAPDKLNLKDICFNETMSFADCLHNLRLIKNFCAKYLPWNVFHFCYEDILYMHESLQSNVNAFITDLFFIFESSQDVKSPPIGASVTKRFFNRVGIPDLRSGGERDSSTKHVDHHHNKSIPRPTKLQHQTHPPKEPLTATNSIGTSRMNSTDSLMTEKSCDSLKYQAYKTTNSASLTPLTPSTTFAEGMTDSLISSSKLSPTTTFGEVSSSPLNGAVADPRNYLRSDSLNSNSFDAASVVKGPSWGVRMQLEEKRRQIEAQQMLEKKERIKQGQQINKDAFMKLYGKQPMSTSLIQNSRIDEEATSPSLIRSSTSASSTISSSNSNNNNNSAPQYDEISKSILEIKEQMKRLAVEQERLQQNLNNNVSNTRMPLPQNAPMTMSQSFYDANDAAAQLTYAAAAPSLPHPSMSHSQSGGPPVLTPGPFLANGHTMIRYAREPEPFRLHNDEETLSRLDPSLELTTNLMATNGGGIVYKGSSSKTPRRTWGDNQQQQQQFVEQQQMFSVPPTMEQLYAAQQQSMFMSGAVPPPPHPMMAEMVPAEPHWAPPPPPVDVQYVPVATSIVYVSAASTSPMSTMAWPPTVSVVPAASSSVVVSPSSSATFVASDGEDDDATAKYYTPVSHFEKASDIAINQNLNANETPPQSAQRPVRSLSPSPGIGFVVGDGDDASAIEARKKELIVAAALRRKAQLDRRREMLDEESVRRQEELAKKEESDKQRKREREERRMKIFEEHQRKKAEQEALELQNGNSSKSTSMSVSQTSSTLSKNSLHKNSQQRSTSAVGKSVPNVRTTSAENLDQIDGKSQSSDGAGSSSQISEPSVKLFVKPSQKSNRNIIYNAIQYCVLAGSVNDEKKRKCLEELAKSDSKHFLILFRDQKCQFRGLYSWDQTSDVCHKLFGLGPNTCSEKFTQLLFKYDSGAKQFSQIPSKHFSATIDGFTIGDTFWQSKKQLYGKSKTMK